MEVVVVVTGVWWCLQVCGRQCFVVVNVVVVVLNLYMGLVLNVVVQSPRGPSQPLITITKAAPDNTTAAGVGAMVPAALGVSDASGNFTLHAFVWAAQAWQEVTAGAEVCLATHTSVDWLHWVAHHAATWTGPMSVAVFASGREYAVAAAMVAYLRRCVEGVEARVTFHLVHPQAYPPEPAAAPLPVLPCGETKAVNAILVAAVGLSDQVHLRYPQNLLRNLAWRTCHTPYTLNVDVDMLTPPHMYTRLRGFLYGRAVCGRCAWVVPVYEVHSEVSELPAEKMDLLMLVVTGKARRFHIEIYKKNQGNSHLEEWEVSIKAGGSSSAPYAVLYNVTAYEEYWEPVVVVARGAPGFDERFIGYGFTRNSQINRIRYQMFKKELHARLSLPQPPPLSRSTLKRSAALVVVSGRKPRRAVSVKGVRGNHVRIDGKEDGGGVKYV
ncbi:Beta-1,4-glucuronyltransferase 1 [Chionoecetes opilio]|uniref:Beta-1,4-glucuronyltransferase 1 n=1 Tax=Chionoecetes opilio TaxID=41210 RepID=A0A8J4XVE6_CHIOP|nr:Beta-1,4-glucuronyltransferase 1 [Chionoecetes opilio]